MSIEVANPNYTNTVGTPIEDFNATPAHQECLDTCDIHSQQQIMSMFGINATETDLVKDAIIHGEYAPLGCEGTSILHTGNLLERHGIYVHRCINATIDDLISELSQGHKIIVAVDADEIWAEDEKSLSAEYIKDVISPESNHAVVVVGVDTVTGDVDVVDPGDGNLKRINSNVFVNAWQDSHFFMMATNQSPQEYMINVSNNNNEEVTAMNDPKNNNNFVKAYEEKVDATLRDQEVSGYDTYVLQTNQNGNPEVVGVDVDGDGKLDFIGTDLDDDGRADVVALDVDGNGIADVYLIDTNSDGEPDFVGVDIDGDGKLDNFTSID